MMVLLENCATENAPQLVFANLLWRHGSRSPVTSYPSDPYNGKPIWPQGPGQLTNVGMRQQHELGQYFRQRYNNFLSKHYKRSEIYVRSTDVDRTLMSAECNMAGLYPPSGRQKWNGTNTTWQPLPVHTVPEDTDLLLIYPAPHCPKYFELLSEIYQSKIYKLLQAKYAPFLKEIANLTQWNGKLSIMQAWIGVQDVLVLEKSVNLPLPSWVTEERLAKLNEIAGLDIAILFGGVNPGYRVKVAKAGGAGNLLKTIVHNIDSAINGKTESTYKIVAYSAHDTTLAALLIAVDAFDMTQPPLASSIMFEVYRMTSGNQPSYTVKTFYRNSVDHDPLPLSILGCDFECPFEEFKERIASITPDDPDKECGRSTLQDDQIWRLRYSSSSLLVLIWIVIVLVGIIVAFRSKKSEVRFSKV
ncbi:unnamed protein product [Clavelina lepadiformis]|uniref:acid phosphatase n=1 Tax=Clavelina lepadiformis TaxID=159417 RepID=A0ABP0GN66_CLALP